MNVNGVQRRLWEQSRQHRAHRESDVPLFPVNKYEKRIRGLMDLMHQPQWIAAACDRVLQRSRGKAAGVDGVTAADFQKQRRTELETLRQELRHGKYQPQPLRRVMIPKANGKLRPLGIPCLRDKIVQEAIRMALEPIFEAEFHDSSYGFRPNRSTHHAIFRCRQMMHRGFTWVIEGDVKACFDEISHKAILSCLREKVMDNKFLGLIGRLLKAGVNIDGAVHPTEKGVPQGGVVSPLLANVVLNKLDWFLHGQGQHGVAAEQSRLNGRPNVRFVRYADDWCVFITRGSKRYAGELRDQIQSLLLRECGVELSLEKTHITHVRDGFDFLGFHLELGIGKDGKYVPKIKVPRKAVADAVQSLNSAMRRRPQQESAACRIIRGSAVVRGWSNYFKIGHNFSKVAGLLDHHAFWIAAKALCRKFDLSTAQCLAKYARGSAIGVSKGCTLQRASDIKMSLDFRNPEPYTPGTTTYPDDLDWEADFQMYESHKRPGSMDFKVLALRRDGFRCRKCGAAVTCENSEADHIQPVSSFAHFAQAHLLENVQTLCLACHQEKTRAGRVKKHRESRMLGNLHVRFGVGAEVELLGPHHLNAKSAEGETRRGEDSHGD
ncbi:MAG: group II intron reverse transcriptase/maturase [Planctomycetota bacterium]|nr:group II intron reverse transcriptase/maturase [Planctomycetota bacterium]